MSDINAFFLSGRLTKDSVVKTVGDFTFLEFTVANNEYYKSRNEQKSVSYYFYCQLFGEKAAKALVDKLKTGVHVFVEGKVRTWSKKRDDGSWDNNVAVIVSNVRFNSIKNDRDSEAYDEDERPPYSPEDDGY